MNFKGIKSLTMKHSLTFVPIEGFVTDAMLIIDLSFSFHSVKPT
ncbi:hypothetical protein PPRY_a1962 [Pseudoalteromonas prydzensis ACAM 620]|nr:hypothetical protein [Pseudoalteromonas prydzensis ACAM 620]